MTRRLVLAAGGLAVVALLSSCSSVSKPAASINGENISMSDFDDLAAAYAASNAAAAGSGTPVGTDVIDGDTARQVLTYAIQTEVIRQGLAKEGITVSDADRTAQAATFEATDPEGWKALPDELKQLFTERQAMINAFTELVGTPAAEIEKSYSGGITESGIACVSHILVATEAEATAVEKRLADGEDFAAVAQEVSIDTGSGASGGALVDQATGGACTDVATFSSTYVPEFVAAALDAEVGVPTAPVQSQFGYHVILVRPFAEVGDEVVAAQQQAELAPKAAELFDGVTINVSPSIGTWSSSSKSVAAIDSAPAGE